MYRALLLSLFATALVGCIGDLPQEEFPCLIAADLYNKYNEAYVFSPQGEQKRLAMERSQKAEQDCASGNIRSLDPAEGAPDGQIDAR
jgi:hypothetical protein